MSLLVLLAGVFNLSGLSTVVVQEQKMMSSVHRLQALLRSRYLRCPILFDIALTLLALLAGGIGLSGLSNH